MALGTAAVVLAAATWLNPRGPGTSVTLLAAKLRLPGVRVCHEPAEHAASHDTGLQVAGLHDLGDRTGRAAGGPGPLRQRPVVGAF